MEFAGRVGVGREIEVKLLVFNLEIYFLDLSLKKVASPRRRRPVPDRPSAEVDRMAVGGVTP